MNEILMYGPIGPDLFEPENSVTARKVMEQLAQCEGDITVRISSPGGDVYEGINIMTALREYPGRVTVVVEALAASAASFIAVGGGDEVVMRESSEMMIHRAATMADGNSDDLRKKLADLDRQDNKLAAIYASKAGGESAQWLDAMARETWYTAQEAVEAGLADRISEATPAAPAPSARGRFKFANRAAAPPPPISTPSDGQEGEGMSILNQLAQELGREPEEVQNALSGFFNEVVSISGEVDVTYPEGVKVAPTEKVAVRPLFDGVEGEPPAGVTFEVTPADGYTADVDEAGVVTITAPSGVEPGDTAEFTVTVNETTVPLGVEVRALSDQEDDAGEAEQVEAAPASESVTLDQETYNDLRAAAQLGWKAMEAEKVAKLDAEVDGWVSEGRISAALRPKAIKAIHTNAELARDLYGSNPAGTIPRNEIGAGHDPANDSTVPSADDLRALSESRRKSGK